MFRVLTATAASLALLTACFPAADTIPYRDDLVASSFSVTVNGEETRVLGGSFIYEGDDYDIDIKLRREGVNVGLVNKSDNIIRINLDNSAFVLRDGTTTRPLSGELSYADRNTAQPAIVVPSSATSSIYALPQSNLYFSEYSGSSFLDLFEWPPTTTVTFRLVLSADVGGETEEIDIAFVGNPLPESIINTESNE